MPIVRRLLVASLIALITVPSSVFADEQHLVSPGQLASAVSEHVASQDTDRAAIREALARPQVRSIAESMGVDLSRVSAAADTIRGAELTRAADAARQVNQQLVGGASTVVISTTTIIIILLLLILLVVIVKS